MGENDIKFIFRTFLKKSLDYVNIWVAIIISQKRLHIIGGVSLKKYKKLSLVLVVFLIASMFTGCNMEEKELVDAFIKSQEMTSLESTSNIAFNLSAQGLDAETQVVFDEVVNQINEMKLSINQKSVMNKDQTVAKAQIDANVKVTDMSFDSSIWVDMDMNGDKPVLREIFKLPSMLMSLIPGAAEKEYIVLDLDKMSESIASMEEDMPEPVNFDETMAIAMKYQEKFKDAFVGYIKNYDSDLAVVSKLEDQTVNGEKIKYYQVAFDNDSFKKFLKETTISMLQDKDIMPLFEEYMTELMKASGEEMPEELSITKNIGEIVKKTTEFFDKLEKLTILGKDGIVITFGINEDGYFVSEQGEMDFVIDTKAFMELAADSMEGNQSLPEMATPVFDLLISYDSHISNINQDVKITMPTVTEENSIGYMDLIETMVAQIPEVVVAEGLEDQGLSVVLEGELVEFTNQPILVDNHYLVSSRDMAKAFDAAISWNEDTKEIEILKDENKLIFNTSKNQLVVNGEVQTLSTPVTVKDSVSYIPLRAMAENLGYTFKWDQAYKMMIITK